ncbi:hypothetical protein PtA15_8A716 [Puccinia triticina]|uniref:Phospholipid scramblase n=1 Tax=Puccinia triticina TaxID=208348 RepID=A0ABY7CRA9_9BASI|nr:uncharacterized protein PtA15_8A716 [Puccinia triticina]WAQ87809.1 hypothetical protein PtA15_8A716 [Puccinia triticina]WAR57684.1 hypothetical protein PtB15_8B737 [Puccinia triticina]
MASTRLVLSTLNRRLPAGTLPSGHRCSYSPLPVRPTPKARKSSNQGKQKPNPPALIDQNAPSPWNLGSLWNPGARSLPNNPSFPWTDYESGLSPKLAPPRATNVPSGGAGASRSAPASSVVVRVPDHPHGPHALHPAHPAAPLLSQSALVIVRQLEMLNLFVGFEQANRYRILSPTGQTLGFLAEEERGLSGTLFRQLAGTHRAFQASIFDPLGIELLRIRRPFSLINSRIFVEHSPTGDPQQRAIVGESQQEFHLWRRRYNLFTRLAPRSAAAPEEEDQQEQHYDQFARIDAGFLSWDFFTLDANGRPTGSVSKNFTGFGREIFTDTGQYVVRFDAVDAPHLIQQSPSPATSSVPHSGQSAGLTLDQRAVILATAVSIDFDYFSRSHRGGLMPPIFFGGGSSSDGDF